MCFEGVAVLGPNCSASVELPLCVYSVRAIHKLDSCLRYSGLRAIEVVGLADRRAVLSGIEWVLTKKRNTSKALQWNRTGTSSKSQLIACSIDCEVFRDSESSPTVRKCNAAHQAKHKLTHRDTGTQKWFLH